MSVHHCKSNHNIVNYMYMFLSGTYVFSEGYAKKLTETMKIFHIPQSPDRFGCPKGRKSIGAILHLYLHFNNVMKGEENEQ